MGWDTLISSIVVTLAAIASYYRARRTEIQTRKQGKKSTEAAKKSEQAANSSEKVLLSAEERIKIITRIEGKIDAILTVLSPQQTSNEDKKMTEKNEGVS